MVARDVIRELSQQIRQIERSRSRCVSSANRVAVDLPGIDGLIGEPSWPRGCLVEFLAEGRGAGSASLALLASRAAWRDALLIVIDSRRELYVPAAVSLEMNAERTIFIRPDRPPDVLWSLEQALRTRGIGAVVCDVEQLSPQACRRLQLAAEMGGGLGLLLRPARARGQPSFAEYRFLVQPLPSSDTTKVVSPARRWRIELLRARGQFTEGSLVVELHDEPGGLCVAAELASATPAA
jgi:protein ImuA